MKKMLGLIVVFIFFHSHAQAKVWDMEKFFPGDMARTHDLVSAKGEKLTYSFPGGGAFGRVVDVRGTDWQFWSDAGMYYMGWFWQEPGGPFEAFWMSPANMSIPKFFDDQKGWTTKFSDILVHGRYKGAELELVSAVPETIEIDIHQTLLPGGKVGILARGGSLGVYEERWYFDGCIPVYATSGCAPGVRKIQMLYGPNLEVGFERTFEFWAPKN